MLWMPWIKFLGGYVYPLMDTVRLCCGFSFYYFFVRFRFTQFNKKKVRYVCAVHSILLCALQHHIKQQARMLLLLMMMHPPPQASLLAHAAACTSYISFRWMDADVPIYRHAMT